MVAGAQAGCPGTEKSDDTDKLGMCCRYMYACISINIYMKPYLNIWFIEKIKSFLFV